jgi:AraC-like DNA-binding protein
MRRLPVDDISILVGNLNNLLGTLSDLGISTAPILDRNRLVADEFCNSQSWMPLRKYIQILGDILDTTNVNGLGLKAGDRMEFRDQGLFGYATASCSNLSKAIDIYHRYAPISGVYIFGDMQEVGDEVKFTFDASVLKEWPEMLRYEVELEFALWAKLKHNWKKPIDWIDEIQFSFSQPGYAQMYQEYFCCPVSFDQPINQIIFAREHLETPFELADEELFRLSAQQCERILQELPNLKGISGEIRSMLARSGGRFPTFTKIAKELNMSEATLRRRLATEGTRYKSLLLDFRIALASRYLDETRLSVADIAHLTGYTDAASLSRAFSALMGRSPGAYRDD